MSDAQALARGRQAFGRHEWAECFRLLESADRETALEPGDLDRAAVAAYLIGKDEDSERFRGRAHQQYLERGDVEAAARTAFWLAFGLLHRGAHAPASGWLARAARLLEDARLECVVRGYLLIPPAIQRIVRGDPGAGHAAFSEAAAIATRYADRDLASIACHGRGRALIRLGRAADGVVLLDEAMAAVIAGDVSPAVAGDVYCSVIEGCTEIFDLRRAHEWTASLAQWCARQPDMVRYRGECLLYRAELRQLRGDWTGAEEDARRAAELLLASRGRPAAGAAFYRMGELHRLRGDFPAADAAYREAHECGRKPQPGLSLLRLAQGHADSAAASIRTVLPEIQAGGARARILAAAVDILLAAGDVEGARAAAVDLEHIASQAGATFLAATSAQANGAVALACGDTAAAASALGRAWEGWRDLEMPYEEAQVCVLQAALCERAGDREGRRIELDTARRLFARLNAGPGVARVAQLTAAGPLPAAGPLSEREAQVLRLLAAGKTNRTIGEELFISEKTVARHVSNIFDKLGVSSRAGATAWACQRNLV